MAQTNTFSDAQSLYTPLKARAKHVLRAFFWSDALASTLCLWLSLSLLPVDTHPGLHIALSGVFTLAVFLGFRNRAHYSLRKALADQLRSIFGLCALGFLSHAALAFLTEQSALKLAIILYWLAFALCVPTLRWATRQGLEKTGVWSQSIVLICGPNLRNELETRFQDRTEYGFEVTAHIDLSQWDKSTEAQLDTMLASYKNESFYLAPDASCQAQASRLASQWALEGRAFYYQPAIGALPTQNFDILDIPPSEGIVFAIKDSLDRPIAQGLKRGFDILATGLGLIFLAPIFVVLIALIRRDGGPAFFAQPRVGKDGKVFSCLKFRSMAVDAEARLAHMIETDETAAREWEIYKKLSHDPRITPVGRWIRKLSLDELPQLINIFRGEMSLIGPRPMMIDQIDDYGREFEAYKRMRPGLTGLWQVNGRHSTTFAERARLDTWYARNWSLWRDCVILIRTVKEVLLAKGG